MHIDRLDIFYSIKTYDNSSKGILKFEYDYIIEGNNTSYLGYKAGYEDLNFKNNNGHIF